MQHLVKLRYYPGDPLKVILEKDIQALAARWSLKVFLEDIKGEMTPLGEETIDKDLERISQTVVTLETDHKESLKNALRDIVRIYRSPRTVFSLWGSNKDGEHVALQVFEEFDGWW